MAKEATIEEKIRTMKKEKAKERGAGNRRMEVGQPKRKRMRMQENEIREEQEDCKRWREQEEEKGREQDQSELRGRQQYQEGGV